MRQKLDPHMKRLLPIVLTAIPFWDSMIAAAEPVKSGSGLLAPDYSVITKLPPNKAAGYYMAPSLARMPGGTLVAATCFGDKKHKGTDNISD